MSDIDNPPQDQLNVDPNIVIDELVQRCARLTYENAMLSAAMRVLRQA